MSRDKPVIRPMRQGEEMALWRVFHHAIHQLAKNDYSAAQLAAWSPESRDPQTWGERMRAVSPFVVEQDGKIAGFSDLQSDGLIDFMFVHPDAQGQGVARLLMTEIERRAELARLRRLYAHVSLTAEAVFTHYGFVVSKRQVVTVSGVELQNAVMVRELGRG